MMYVYHAVVRRIVDGDTVDCDIDLGFDQWIHRARVRLKGVDAPETRTLDLVEKAYGLMVARRVEELLPVGSTVTLFSHEYRRDGFGRIIGDFEMSNGNLLTHALLEERLVTKWNPDDRVGMHIQERENLEWILTNGRADPEWAKEMRVLLESER